MDCHRNADFNSEEAVEDLCAQKDQFWCKVCDKPMFFKIDCPFRREDGDDAYIFS